MKRLLIANRGEIAIRIIHACRVLDITPLSIHSQADQGSLHERLADQSYYLGSGNAKETYLNIDKIIEAAYWLGADSIHPGYGFLSENPEFAQRVIEEGFTWVGPNFKQIEELGDKIRARKIADEVGLPVVPGSLDNLASYQEAKSIAREIGYPIILKASYGGGGMGMRVVQKESQLKKAYEQTQKQVEAAFGRPEIFIEKYITRPKHIEFQFLADTHGNVIHLHERECSLQRRHQKVLEEAPSTILSKNLRTRIGNKVVNLAKKVGYVNAGTAEFLYKDGKIFFNEVNTRIQVEHPVTEMVTGTDLIIEQLKISRGESLSMKQNEVPLKGHSIEMRINAEDPLNNFYPSPGKVKEFETPIGPFVRFDTYLYRGYEVPGDYDSLIGKLIVWGSTREIARKRALYSLRQLNIIGFPTNLKFHEALLKHPDYISGNVHTTFIEESDILERVYQEFLASIVALYTVKKQTSKVILPNKLSQSRWREQTRREAVGWSA